MILLLFLVALVVSSNPIVVHFKQNVDFARVKHPILGIPLKDMSWEDSGKVVVHELQQTAEIAQKHIRSYLDAMNVQYASYWIANVLVVESPTKALIEFLRTRDEVADIDVATEVHIPNEELDQDRSTPRRGNEWNVEWVKAPAAWAKGFKGDNVVVAELDTGCVIKHPDLVDKYRGNKGGSFDHNYNWFDGVVKKNCKNEPCDKHGHGTHVMGTIVGSSSKTNVGMAPNAKFMSCRSFATGSAGVKDILNCFQFFLNPTKTDGSAPDTTKRPHVINHSWGGGSPKTEFHKAAQALHAAKVLNIFAAGNSGSRCSSMGYPAAFEDMLSVAALAEESDDAASFSSRGPASGHKKVKPEISCPGENINSCSSTGRGYRKMSGTSMATPCVVGSTALLYSAKPGLIGDIEGTKKALFENARPIKTTDCSSEQEHPNNVFGWGAVDNSKL